MARKLRSKDIQGKTGDAGKVDRRKEGQVREYRKKEGNDGPGSRDTRPGSTTLLYQGHPAALIPLVQGRPGGW